jgi:hypothetical protein
MEYVGPCAVANCERVSSKTVLIEGVNGQKLDDPIPIRVCLPCFAYYGLVEAPETCPEDECGAILPVHLSNCPRAPWNQLKEPNGS